MHVERTDAKVEEQELLFLPERREGGIEERDGEKEAPELRDRSRSKAMTV